MTLADKPIYGEPVTLLHPYDVFDLLHGNPDYKWEQVGETGIPVAMGDGRHYLASSQIGRVDGKLYVQTTTVPFKSNTFVI